MIAVTKFEAYALSRPNGWPGGLYHGAYGDDGLRLFRDGNEVLVVPRGTAGVRVSGAELTFQLPGGELVVEIRPPPPADPMATALAFALGLAGERPQQKRVLKRTYGVSCGLVVLAFLPTVAGIAGAFFSGFWVTGLGALSSVLCLVVFRSGWDESKRRHTAIGLAVLGMMAVVTLTVVGLMFRGTQPAPPVYR